MNLIFSSTIPICHIHIFIFSMNFFYCQSASRLNTNMYLAQSVSGNFSDHIQAEMLSKIQNTTRKAIYWLIKLYSPYFMCGWLVGWHVGIVSGLHLPSRHVAPIGSPAIEKKSLHGIKISFHYFTTKTIKLSETPGVLVLCFQ